MLSQLREYVKPLLNLLAALFNYKQKIKFRLSPKAMDTFLISSMATMASVSQLM